MTQLKQRAIGTLIIWGVVLALFIPLFFSYGGADGYAMDRTRILCMALLFGAGYLLYFFMLYRTKEKDGVISDERDDTIVRKATGAAFIITLAYIYFLSITLFEIYRDPGFLPVGWMWFFGYSAIFIGYISNSIAILAMDHRMSGHEET